MTTFGDENSDGRFDFLGYTSGPTLMDRVTLWDNNLDGQADLRVGPMREIAVWVESAWRELILEGDERFVDVDGRKVAVDVLDGVYKSVDAK